MTFRSASTLRHVCRVAAAAALLVVAPASAGAQTEGRPHITVTGSGSVQVEPDEALVRLGVESEAPTAQEAQLGTNRIASAILAAVAAVGVGPQAIQTSQLSLWPVYENLPLQSRGERRPRVVAYRATNTVSARLTDLTHIGPVIDAAIEAGANRVEGVDLGLRDDRDARQRALAAAVTEARLEAATIAEALGVGLGDVLEVTDQGVQVPRFDLRQRSLELAAADSTPVATGTIDVSANVLLRFAIDQD